MFATVKNNERVRVYDNSAFGSAMSWYQYSMVDGVGLVLGPRIGPYTAYFASNASGSLVSDTYPPTSTTVEESGISSLVSKAGATDADLGEMASYHQDGQDVANSFGVLSGVSVSSPVVMAGSTITPVGVPQNYPSPVVMVGWI